MLLLGATSDIGRATAKAFAAAGWKIMLAARDIEAARRTQQEIAAAGGKVAAVLPFDVLQPETFGAFVEGLPFLPDAVVCMVGMLGEQARAEAEPIHATAVLRTNFEGPALLLERFAALFAARGRGVIVGVGSVAGDRGRASNYAYGAAKAGFHAYLSGLRNRLARAGVRVVTVKPGFVRTRMTAGMALPPLFTAEPGEVARAILTAVESGRGDVIYVRRIWRPAMAVIRALPEALFKRLRL
jgi:NAD(P)-dependent dehydrogenase (short-subunit alcohol dehydrogenase family)